VFGDASVGVYRISLLSRHLSNREKQWGILVAGTARAVEATRYRVPDISVLGRAAPPGPILEEPPFLCIEILSRKDRMQEMQERTTTSASGSAASG
jgi:Uma2 family endonuclease